VTTASSCSQIIILLQNTVTAECRNLNAEITKTC